MKEETYIDSDGQELVKTTWDDGEVWYTNDLGEWHRTDGPARIDSDGTEEYYLEDRQISKREIDLIWLKKQVDK